MVPLIAIVDLAEARSIREWTRAVQAGADGKPHECPACGVMSDRHTAEGTVQCAIRARNTDLRRNHGQPEVDAPTFFWSEQARR